MNEKLDRTTLGCDAGPRTRAAEAQGGAQPLAAGGRLRSLPRRRWSIAELRARAMAGATTVAVAQ